MTNRYAEEYWYGQSCNGRLNNKERGIKLACPKNETGEGIGVPDIVLYGAETWTMRKEWCGWRETPMYAWCWKTSSQSGQLESRVAQAY